MSKNINNLIIHTSTLKPSEIVGNLKAILQEKGVTLFQLIDHSGEAKKAGINLPFEQLLIFGDPKTGTLLMQENPLIGIELPLKILVSKHPEGNTQIAYKDPNFLAKEYGIEKNAPVIKKMSEAMAHLVENLTQAIK